jgi:hypothetical protein
MLTAALAAGFWTSRAFAQETKDLQVEVTPYHRPWRRPPPVYEGPVQVSLMPIGPSTLSIGEPLKFRMVSLAESFGHLYVLSASGRSQLWMENVRLHAGAPIVYPRPGLIVRASPPTGDEVVIFAATRSRIAGFLGGGSSLTPFDLQYTHEALRAALQSQLNALPRDDWAIAEINIRVQE